jgi:hypothetical protein
VHTTGLAPVHTPAWQVSVCVHALPSLHDAPLAFEGFEQIPVEVLQTPAVWHWSSAVHVTPPQMPPLTVNDPLPLTRLTIKYAVPALAGVTLKDEMLSLTPTPALVLEASRIGLPFASGVPWYK